MRQPNQQSLAEALAALETGVAKPVQAPRPTYAEARADLDAKFRAGQPVPLRNINGDVIGEARIATFGGAAPALRLAAE